jgi:ATP-binding cassette subfamily B protein
MKKISNLYCVFYPFLNLKNKDKSIFFLIVLFSLFVIFFDMATLSILTLIFFESENQISSKTNDILEILLNKSNLSISYFHFQILMIALSLLFRNVFYLMQDYLIKSFIFSQYNTNSKKLFKLYASSELIKFYKRGIDYYLKNLNKETWYCYLGILYGLLYVFIDTVYFLMIVFTGIYLIDIDFSINLIFVIFVFIFFISILLIKLKKKGVDRLNYEQKYYRDTLNILKSYLEIKVYKKIKFFTDSYSTYLKNFSKAMVFQGVSNLLPKAIIEFLTAAVLVYYLIYNDLGLNLELFTLIGFVLFRIAPVLARVLQNINLITFYFPSSKILINENKYYSSNVSPNTKIIINENIESLMLMNANFSYSDKKIIRNFNYKFTTNKIYGMYGESGKGKTTLLMLLSGLVRLDSGKFKINKINYADKEIDWGKKLGFMSQNNILIDDSLSNSLFLDKNFDPKLLGKAKKYLTIFKLRKLIKLLNKKYDGNYSLNGMLSGGEKQRISIIRTILLGGDILFFDEPTSSLDRKNENIAMKEIQKLKKNKIIIISTHKKNLRNFFDKTIYL